MHVPCCQSVLHRHCVDVQGAHDVLTLSRFLGHRSVDQHQNPQVEVASARWNFHEWHQKGKEFTFGRQSPSLLSSRLPTSNPCLTRPTATRPPRELPTALANILDSPPVVPLVCTYSTAHSKSMTEANGGKKSGCSSRQVSSRGSFMHNNAC